MGIDGIRNDDESGALESAEEWGLIVHVTPHATMADFLLAVRLAAAGDAALEAKFYARMEKEIGLVYDVLERCKKSRGKSESLEVSKFFSSRLADVPIKFDITPEEWERKKADAGVSIYDGFEPEENVDESGRSDDKIEDDEEEDDDFAEGEQDFPDMHLPAEGATVFDYYEALKDMDPDDAIDLQQYVMSEVYDLVGDEDADEFADMEKNEEKAKRTLLSEFFGGYETTLPFVFDGQKNVARGREETAQSVEDLMRAALTEMPIEEVERELALERIAQIFSDVDPGGDLPPNELWSQALSKANSAVPLIVEARKLGVPEAYIRRCAQAHVKAFVVSADRSRNAQRLNFGVIARFLKNMKFGSDDDVAFFERLASVDRGQG